VAADAAGAADTADDAGWPLSAGELEEAQRSLALRAAAVLAGDPWTPAADLAVAGVFVAFAAGEAGPGHAGDRAWAAAVTWRPATAPRRRDGTLYRDPGRALRGSHALDGPRRAADVDAFAVVAGRVPSPYAAGLLALREGPILAAAVQRLGPGADVVMVDATGLDHPRSAGLALHLGAVTGLPTVGVTRRPLRAGGVPPPWVRGATTPVALGGKVVGRWVCTRTGARPVVAHAAWRTDPDTAAAVTLAASTEAARTPVPLQEARRVAREARAQAGLA
jgi:deoxyribonuclease V